MSWKKRLLKHDRTQKALSWLLAMYIRLVFITSRKTYCIEDTAKPYMRGDDNAHEGGIYTEALLEAAPTREGNRIAVKQVISRK